MKTILIIFFLTCQICSLSANPNITYHVNDSSGNSWLSIRWDDEPITDKGGKRSPVITPQVFHNQDFIAFRSHREISFSYYIYGVEERESLLSGSIILRAHQTKRIPIHCLDEGSYMLTLQIGNLMLKGRFEKE